MERRRPCGLCWKVRSNNDNIYLMVEGENEGQADVDIRANKTQAVTDFKDLGINNILDPKTANTLLRKLEAEHGMEKYYVGPFSMPDEVGGLMRWISKSEWETINN